MPHPDDLTPEQARANIAAHEKAHGKVMQPPHGAHDTNDEFADREGELGPPDWHKQGRNAPHGWKQVGDTFVEEP